jgi:hypothetical protein
MIRKKIKLILFIIIFLLLTSSVYFLIQNNNIKNKNIELESELKNNQKKLMWIKEINDTAFKESVKSFYAVELFYNGRTGELYPIFEDYMNPHTCVWSIWGNSGSETVVITRGGNMYNMDSYDYMGHVLSDNIKAIKNNKFLPPRLPIYLTCIDWNNVVYKSAIGKW